MKTKILLIDDEADILTMVDNMLTMEGYTVITAADGQEGIEKFAVESPDLVITDMKMPRASGLEVIKKISRNSHATGVIVLTGHSDEVTAIECLRAGAYDYLLKPLEDVEVLLVAIERALHKRRLDQENKKLLKQLEELSIRDPLTQLYNYRFLHQRLEDELVRSERYQRPLSLLMLDVDHFKQINDTYGHLFGDFVLQKISRLLETCAREADTLFRYGGEEFCCILPETGEDGVEKTMTRILDVIRNTVFSYDGQSTGITISIGGSSYPVHGRDNQRLLKVAAQALYTAKDRGRNCSCLAETSPTADRPKR